MAVVEALDLHRTYKTHTGTIRRKTKEIEAVRGVSFAIERGELFGLLGPNGAGKTTTIKMLITLLIPTSGSARVLGYDVVKHAREVRKRIGYVFGGGRAGDERLAHRSRQDDPADDALHVRGGRALRQDRGHLEGRDRRRGDARASQEPCRVGKRDGGRGLRRSGRDRRAASTARGRAQRLGRGARAGAAAERPDPSRHPAHRGDPGAPERRERRARLPSRADTRGRIRGARRSRMRTLRLLGVGWLYHMKMI